MLADLNTIQVESQLDWRVEFGLWLRNTPSQRRRQRDVKSLEAYERDVRLMAQWYQARYEVEFEPGQMNTVNLREYFVQFEKSPRTHKRKLASARLLIKYALSVGLLDSDPSEWIPFVEVVEEAPRDLLPDEECRLRAVAVARESDGSLLGLRDSLLFHLWLDAGLRISESVNLQLSDLEKLEKGKIHVFGKGRKNRNPHVNSKLASRIRLWLERMPVSVEGTLITDERGLAIDRHTAWDRFKSMTSAADVVATPHTMRHQFVMNYIGAYMQGNPLRFGAALKAAAQETGDNVEVLLNHYTGPRESDMRAAVEAM